MGFQKDVTAIITTGVLTIVIFCNAITAGEPLSLEFQEGVSPTSEYTGTMDIGLFKWALPAKPYSKIGKMGYMKLQQNYHSWTTGQHPAGLIYFPDIIANLEALPDETEGEPGHGINAGAGPYIDSVYLEVKAQAISANPNYYQIPLEVCQVVNSGASTGMWTEEDTGIIDGKTRPKTNATYRNYPLTWDFTHVQEYRDSNPANNQQGEAGDCVNLGGIETHYALLDGDPNTVGYQGSPYESVQVEVTYIIENWLAGDPNLGFHLSAGRNYPDPDDNPAYAGTEDYDMQVTIVSKEGASGRYVPIPSLFTVDETWAPKLIVNYHYENQLTADAGSDMGTWGVDEVKRVKPGVEITLDGSLSKPVVPEAPVVEYKWSWVYGGANYTIVSPNDQTEAQLPVMLATVDNIFLQVTDSMGRTANDSARIKVTPRIPGDLDGDGCVDLTDFVILRLGDPF